MYYTVMNTTGIWEHERIVENTSHRRVFSTFLTAGVFSNGWSVLSQYNTHFLYVIDFTRAQQQNTLFQCFILWFDVGVWPIRARTGSYLCYKEKWYADLGLLCHRLDSFSARLTTENSWNIAWGPSLATMWRHPSGAQRQRRRMSLNRHPVHLT